MQKNPVQPRDSGIPQGGSGTPRFSPMLHLGRIMSAVACCISGTRRIYPEYPGRARCLTKNRYGFAPASCHGRKLRASCIRCPYMSSSGQPGQPGQLSEAGTISLPGWFVYHRATIESYKGLPPGDVVMLWIWRAAKFNRRFGSHVRKQDDIAHHFRDQNRCHILAQAFMHAIAKMQIVRK